MNTTSILGYSNNQQYYFLQPLNNNGTLGTQTQGGNWNNPYASMTVVTTIDDITYVFGLNSISNNWFLQALLPSGEMGPETDHGTWDNFYSDILPLEFDGNTYIFGLNTDNNWFIQQINTGGTMGTETDHGSWDNFYPSMCSFNIGGRCFIFGQRQNNSWFIQEVLSNGTMGSETDNGTWGNFYSIILPLSIGGNTYIFGLNPSNNNWFIQQINQGGTMGTETDSGQWSNFYPSMSSFTDVGGNSFIFGQRPDDNYWFIQQINIGGKMGSETASGTWNNYYDHILGFNHYNTASWMGDFLGEIGNTTLANLSIPATHDSGTYFLRASDAPSSDIPNEFYIQLLVATIGYPVAQYWATTQTQSFYEQLMGGIRCFDVRPCKYYKDFYLYHGLLGPELTKALNDISSFLNSPGVTNELVILEITHIIGNDGEAPDSTVAQEMLNLIYQQIGGFLVNPGAMNGDLPNLTLNELVGGGSKVLIIYENSFYEKYNALENFYGYNFNSIYDKYANTFSLTQMTSDQLSKYQNPDNHTGLFSIDWTLTPTEDDIKAYYKETWKEIIPFLERDHLAFQTAINTANAQLGNFIYQYGLAPNAPKMNFIFVDLYQSSSVVGLCMKLNGLS